MMKEKQVIESPKEIRIDDSEVEVKKLVKLLY